MNLVAHSHTGHIILCTSHSNANEGYICLVLTATIIAYFLITLGYTLHTMMTIIYFSEAHKTELFDDY